MCCFYFLGCACYEIRSSGSLLPGILQGMMLSGNLNLQGRVELCSVFKFQFPSAFQPTDSKPNPEDITNKFNFCSEKFFLFFFSAVIFSLASIHSCIAEMDLSIQITFCGEALECLHSTLFKMQFVFCFGRGFVYYVCMYVFLVLA